MAGDCKLSGLLRHRFFHPIEEGLIGSSTLGTVALVGALPVQDQLLAQEQVLRHQCGSGTEHRAKESEGILKQRSNS